MTKKLYLKVLHRSDAKFVDQGASSIEFIVRSEIKDQCPKKNP